MSLPALDDIAAHTGTTEPIDGVVRIETTPLEETAATSSRRCGRCTRTKRSSASTARSTTTSTARPTNSSNTCRTPEASRSGPTPCVASPLPRNRDSGWPTTSCFRTPRSTPARLPTPQARTVDYHCAWDQGKHLWMIYLMRVLDAQVVLDKPGSVVLWTNCRHPFYDKNPYPDAGPARAHRLGRRLLGLVRRGPRAGAEQPQDHRRIPPPPRPADHPGVDEMRLT